jgi:hypothetical protein
MCGTATTSENKNTITNNTSSTYLPAWATQGGQDIYNAAANQVGSHPFQGYTGPTQASFGPEWGQVAGYAGSQLGESNPLIGQSSDALRQVLGTAGKTATSSIPDLMSPYTSAVLQPTLDAIGRDAASRNNSTAAGATMAGAFGDSGYGVQRAMDNDTTQRNIAGATGAAYDKAFTDAEGQRNSALQQLMSGASGLTGNATAQFGENSTLSQLLASMGGTEQTAGQTGITTGIQNNLLNQKGPLDQFALLQSILKGAPMDTTTVSSGTSMGSGDTSKPDNSGWQMGGSLASAALS